MNRDWPCSIKEAWLIGDRGAEQPGDLKGFPQQGCGDRSLFCDQYDNCLDIAAGSDWEGFNCRLCNYSKKLAISFVCSEFETLPDELELDGDLVFCTEDQIERLITGRADQEMILITLMQGALSDEQ